MAFFICIPFSCTFTYFCLRKFFDISWANGFNNMIAFTTCIGCVLIALLYHDQLYTFVTVVAATLTMIFLHFISRAAWIGEASLIYFCLMPGFFMVNGILTGTGLEAPIVNYNPDEILNIRMLTIPAEDAVYGYTQFLLVIYFFKRFSPMLTPQKTNN
ncbi:lycopene cyclase domain-containing protein [Niabella hibiscisoli]|uniref:lycopene cyclase domain-containing protein n=1 Tax=Niabella hibiscisoli TaxID=1825928 RepID=UPI001F0F3282|nr:lycopene cyclase domain-containing protein [Niabella hibiscisoli]MCH5718603.1 lycopene cyclase domain-containing protein [Niabella hibiscisoli]